MRSERYDKSKPAAIICQKFGGLAKFSRAMGKAESSVSRWLESGFIPGKHHAAVLEASRAGKIRLRPADFLESQPAQADAA